jgi:hypothetical protein
MDDEGSTPMTDIFRCTEDNPWAPEKTAPDQRVEHSNVHEIGDQQDGWPGGDIVTMECRNCGTRWREELPQ